MTTELETLVMVLGESVKRHGEGKPLTIGHLHNIAKMTLRVERAREERGHRAAMDALGDDRKWGSD